jgi:hypothetical protein
VFFYGNGRLFWKALGQVLEREEKGNWATKFCWIELFPRLHLQWFSVAVVVTG